MKTLTYISINKVKLNKKNLYVYSQKCNLIVAYYHLDTRQQPQFLMFLLFYPKDTLRVVCST